jgi:hypothetical protein
MSLQPSEKKGTAKPSGWTKAERSKGHAQRDGHVEEENYSDGWQADREVK